MNIYQMLYLFVKSWQKKLKTNISSNYSFLLSDMPFWILSRKVLIVCGLFVSGSSSKHYHEQ